MEFSVQQLQLAVFIARMEASSRLRVASAVTEALPMFRFIDPVLLPLPDNAPPELPHIILTNEAEGWQFQYAPSRYDLVFKPRNTTGPSGFEQALAALLTPCLSLWEVLQRDFGARSSRVGLVASFEAPLRDAAKTMAAIYLIPKVAAEASEIQVHYLHKEQAGEFLLNRWVRLRSQPASDGTREALILLLDINTAPETPLPAVDAPLIGRFASAARAIALRELQLHAH